MRYLDPCCARQCAVKWVSHAAPSPLPLSAGPATSLVCVLAKVDTGRLRDNLPDDACATEVPVAGGSITLLVLPLTAKKQRSKPSAPKAAPAPSAPATSAAPAAGVAAPSLAKIEKFKLFELWCSRTLLGRHLTAVRRTSLAPDGGAVLLWLNCGRARELEFLLEPAAEVRHIVLVEADAAVLSKAVKKYNKLLVAAIKSVGGGRGALPGITAVVADPGTAKLGDLLPWNYDLVFSGRTGGLATQFASADRARTFLSNMGGRLRPGGHAVGLVPEANVIVKRLRSSGGADGRVGNQAYMLEVAGTHASGAFPRGHGGAFGLEYKLTLGGAEPEVGCLVHAPTLARLAAEAGGLGEL